MSDETTAARLRARQIGAVLHLTPLTVAANVGNAVLVAWAFGPQANLLWLGLWLCCIVLGATVGVRAWLRARRGEVRDSAPAWVLRRMLRHATVLGLLWAAVPVVLFPEASAQQQLLIAVLCTGMMCAAGFALATVPAAGFVFSMLVGLGMGYAFAVSREPLGAPLAFLQIFYALIVAFSVRSTARQFNARILAEFESERQAQVIGLLLRDFEEHASDVLWELDAGLRLHHVSARLAAAFSETRERLSGAEVVELLARHAPPVTLITPEESARALAGFKVRLMQGAAFRDVEVPVYLNGRLAWWSLTAKPLLDPEGRVTGWRGVAADVTEMRASQAHIEQLARTDLVTGLANRFEFLENLVDALAPDGRGEPPGFALICIDLDGFKAVNDTLGHDMGDRLLKVVAQRFKAQARSGDLVARLGGDEFGFIVRNACSEEDVTHIAVRLLDCLRQPCEVEGVTVPIGMSMGIAVAPRDGADPEHLMKHADVALYAAKAQGRGQFVFFNPHMGSQLIQRLRMERALRLAVGGEQLHLLYQPQIAVTSGRVLGFEALLRWRHPELGLVPPTEFISVAEESGLISEIGRWVLREACAAAAQWPAGMRVSVNLSPIDVITQDLAAVVGDILAQTGLPARQLELEITESVLLDQAHTTLERLHALRDLGVRIALDDFGTGYSSMAYLRRFPFDKLKIDRTFVAELGLRLDARAVVRAIIEMANALHMEVVAEGVESERELTLLHGTQCGGMQGYLLSAPLLAAEIDGFLAAWERHPAHEMLLSLNAWSDPVPEFGMNGQGHA